MKYAYNKQIKYVVIQGENEIEKEIVQIKNLENRKQEEVKLNELNKYFK
jgi:histidyl-tRNA synthetase